MMSLFKSKKFWAAVGGILVVSVNHFFPTLPEESIQQVWGILVAYILGQGVADIGKEANKLENK